mmetsp:Transcript_170625/g.542015  ORF Transcript_170625/g.542015 Transcript_170625/m.542015 type:complete len:84 (+) Transcript_170625:1365-1616(+)
MTSLILSLFQQSAIIGAVQLPHRQCQHDLYGQCSFTSGLTLSAYTVGISLRVAHSKLCDTDIFEPIAAVMLGLLIRLGHTWPC